RTCRLEPLDAARHCSGLHSANLLDTDHRNWTYLPYGPFARLDDYVDWVRNVAGKDDPQFHAIVDRATGQAVGVASYLRIDPAADAAQRADGSDSRQPRIVVALCCFTTVREGWDHAPSTRFHRARHDSATDRSANPNLPGRSDVAQAAAESLAGRRRRGRGRRRERPRLDHASPVDAAAQRNAFLLARRSAGARIRSGGPSRVVLGRAGRR